MLQSNDEVLFPRKLGSQGNWRHWCGCCFRVLQTVALWRTESAILVGWTLAEFGHRISTEVSCGDNLVVGDRGHA
jgi:hypothetical protein